MFNLMLPVSSFSLPLPTRSTLFPYTTLFRSDFHLGRIDRALLEVAGDQPRKGDHDADHDDLDHDEGHRAPIDLAGRKDRKSTRLNSSHQIISYAVFCLKKKN